MRQRSTREVSATLPRGDSLIRWSCLFRFTPTDPNRTNSLPSLEGSSSRSCEVVLQDGQEMVSKDSLKLSPPTTMRCNRTRTRRCGTVAVVIRPNLPGLGCLLTLTLPYPAMSVFRFCLSLRGLERVMSVSLSVRVVCSLAYRCAPQVHSASESFSRFL